ncbi:MAG: hypothetical protein WCA10_22570 [Terracidiphilus sp.]
MRTALVACSLLIATLAAAQGNQADANPTLFSDGSSGPNRGFGASGGGQVEPSAYRIERFTRLSLFVSASPLGLGEQISTNLSPHLDLRVLGDYISVNTYQFSQRDFRIRLNMGFVNMGASTDYYPFHKPFRLSAGYLFYNGDRLRAELKANQNAVFTINNIDWTSDNADPVHGTGRLTLGGSGFLLTAGYGRIVSRSEKHFSFPFEAGVAFINTPHATFDLRGQICSDQGINCQPAATYPGFADALAAQLVTWNKDVAPYHIYPVVEGGVAYTFSLPRRRF